MVGSRHPIRLVRKCGGSFCWLAWKCSHSTAEWHGHRRVRDRGWSFVLWHKKGIGRGDEAGDIANTLIQHLNVSRLLTLLQVFASFPSSALNGRTLGPCCDVHYRSSEIKYVQRGLWGCRKSAQGRCSECDFLIVYNLILSYLIYVLYRT